MGRRILGQNQNVAAQDVIHIDALLWQHIDKWNIAGCFDERLIEFFTTDNQRVFSAKLCQLASQFSGLAASLPLDFKLSTTSSLPSAAFT